MATADHLAEEIMKCLQEYANLTDAATKVAVKKAAAQVKKEISQTAPKDTGAYARSWKVKKIQESSHNLNLTVCSPRRYPIAHLLENGHARRGGGREVDGIKHSKPAEDHGLELLEQELRKGLS